MMRRLWFSLVLLWLLASISSVDSTVSNDVCSIFVYVPFTNNGTASASLQARGVDAGNPGFAQMSAAMLAIDHFNTRNATMVVPELAQLQDCSVQLNLGAVFDTGTVGHMASRSFQKKATTPCAMAGPFNDGPALELSALATASEIPIVVHRAFNQHLAEADTFPYTTQIFPGMRSYSTVLSSYLLELGRDNFVSILYPLTLTGIQRYETLTIDAERHGIRTEAHPYFYNPDRPDEELNQERSLETVMDRIKTTGFRTICMAVENPLLDLPAIAAHAERLGLNNGDHVWVLLGIFDPSQVNRQSPTLNPNVTKLLSGAAWVSPLESFLTTRLTQSRDPFLDSWTSQGAEFVARANAANPIAPDEPGYFVAQDNHFNASRPELGSGFLYDAVMSIGIGACLAERTGNNTVSSLAHLEGIQSANFQGASGQVRFGNDNYRPGARDSSGVTWGAFSILAPGIPQNLGTSHWIRPGDGDQWTTIAPFIFSDGRTEAPALLRDQADQNYLPRGLRIFGFTLMGIAISAALASVIWIFKNRNHPVLKAAQPHFLFVICFGSIITACSILTISNDESYGWSEQQLSSACMGTVWLIFIGYCMIYSALFTKLWRVNRVLQFARRKVEVRHVAWPMGILIISVLIVLSLWTALEPLHWNRVEINDFTGASIGQCDSKNTLAFIIPLACIALIPTVLTMLMAWKTKDVDDSFAESWWIFLLIVMQLEIIVVSAPIIVLLRDVSTEGRYVGFVMMLWTFPMSTLCVIMLPKMAAHYRDVKGIVTTNRTRGGGVSGEVRISGISSEQPAHCSGNRPTASSTLGASSELELSRTPAATGGVEK